MVVWGGGGGEWPLFGPLHEGSGGDQKHLSSLASARDLPCSARLRAGLHAGQARAVRNTPVRVGGFWVAAAAAQHAHWHMVCTAWAVQVEAPWRVLPFGEPQFGFPTPGVRVGVRIPGDCDGQ